MTRLRSFLRSVHAFTADRKDLLASVDARDDALENARSWAALLEQENAAKDDEIQRLTNELARRLIEDWS